MFRIEHSRTRSPPPRKKDESISVFLNELQREHPRTTFRFATLRRALVGRYGTMKSLVNSELEYPRRLRLIAPGIRSPDKTGKYPPQRGQYSRIREEFWEYLQEDLLRGEDDRMPAGARHLFANALVDWTLAAIKQY